jgi:ribonuclease R
MPRVYDNTKQTDRPGLAILRDNGLPADFPPAVLAESSGLPEFPGLVEIAAEIARGRRDLRGHNLFTIDGEDARDLDDAVSIERLTGGRFRLGVHIADVAHYVTENSLIDREAFQRGTSVYLADLVVPMLPPRLSNGICSLNPDIDRMALSVILTIGTDGATEDGEIVETIIRSRARTTYNEVKESLESGITLPGRYRGFLNDLKLMQELAHTLTQRRKQRGAIDFELSEMHVIVDETGQPLIIEPYPLSFANGIIESFMIAANEFVAQRFFLQKTPFVYRIHELPDREKLARFLRLASSFGIRTRVRGTPTPGQLAKALEQVRQEPFGTTLAELLLRSLAKARYSPDNAGHFGLASDYYCHFTSPIRRYPDLFIHRVIKASLHAKAVKKHFQALAAVVAEHSSDMERAAMKAERDSHDQMSAIFMSSRLGEIFDGVIAGFGSAGIYVRLASSVEGMVPFRSLAGYYTYDEERMTAADTSGNQVFRLGDPVEVQVARADAALRQIDFELLTHQERPVGQRSAGRVSKQKDRKKNDRVRKTAAGHGRKLNRKRKAR